MTHAEPSLPRTIVLELRDIAKSFGAVIALGGVDLQLRRGELLGLVGDNGAGKSTLTKVILITQRIPDVLAIADRVKVMKGGLAGARGQQGEPRRCRVPDRQGSREWAAARREVPG